VGHQQHLATNSRSRVAALTPSLRTACCRCPLLQDGQGLQVLDARKLGREGQRQLMDRVLRGADQDNYSLLVKMQQRMAR
jgi:hypothetical protein